MSIIIHTEDLVKRYRARTVVNHVSIEVKQGEIVGLLGPNGAGKTTTFYMTVGLIKPDEGRVFINDQDITKLPMYKRAQMGIGYLPQEASVFRKLSIEDNISAVLEMTKLSKAEQREKLESLIKEFRLEHVRKSNGDIVSGGERRRTEIARALAVDPKFILLDEPFAGIDPIAVEDIQAVVARLKYKNIGILITDHNVTETLSICDRAYLLIEGKIFKHGTAEELAEDEQVKKLYLGRNFELKRKDWLLEEHLNDDNKKLLNYVEWMIDQIDNILNEKEKRVDKPSFDILVDDVVLFKEFYSSFYNVIQSIEASEVYRKELKLQTYTSELKQLQIEDKMKTTLMEDITTIDYDLPNYRKTYIKPRFFEALRSAKELLDKCKLIIENPEFADVLN